MQFQFTQTLAHYIAFNWYFVWESPKRRNNRLISTYLPLVASVVLVFIRRAGITNWEISDFVLIGLGIIFVALAKPLVFFIIKRRITKLIQASPAESVIGERTVFINPTHIAMESKVGKGVFECEHFTECIETSAFFYMFLSENQGLILPKSDMPAEIQAELKRILPNLTQK